jgi:hypothetical protein
VTLLLLLLLVTPPLQTSTELTPVEKITLQGLNLGSHPVA